MGRLSDMKLVQFSVIYILCLESEAENVDIYNVFVLLFVFIFLNVKYRFIMSFNNVFAYF